MGRRNSLWVKYSPQDWLDATRDLSPVERALYHDALCLIYVFGDAIRDDPKWIAHQLHVPVQTWVAARKVLLVSSKLKLTPKGLSNDRAEREIAARTKKCEVNQRIALDREEHRREASGKRAEAELSSSRSRAEVEQDRRRSEPNCQSGNEINESGARNVQRSSHHAHARETKDHHHQSKNKKSTLAKFERPTPQRGVERDLQNGLEDDDDRGATAGQRSLAPSLVRDLDETVGVVRSRELTAEYLGSDYAAKAKLLDRAFVGWLRKTYGISVNARGAAAISIGEILATCPTDTSGRPVTKVASAADLAARRRRLERPVAATAGQST